MEKSFREVLTDDQYKLASYTFKPKIVKASVLIVPAMGVSQKFYHKFAEWLCDQGFFVTTFDYRGTGESRKGSLKNFKADIVDWAELDCAAMLFHTERLNPENKIYWIGHSLGGQIIPLVPNNKKIHRIITVATGSGYWVQNSRALVWKVWWLWFVLVPLVTPILGYFPGSRLKKVGDLPRGVIEQWRKWCLNKDYAVGVEKGLRQKFSEVLIPITSFSFADDEMMSAKNTESIHGFYNNAPKKMIRLKPQDIGVKQIGHFGFFKSRFEKLLWKDRLLPELT